MSGSEFIRLTPVTTTAVPIDLGGAREVVIICRSDSLRISSSPAFDQYFTLPPSSGTVGFDGLVIRTSDQRLWIRADSSASAVEIWVVR